MNMNFALRCEKYWKIDEKFIDNNEVEKKLE